jgi:predicted acylesterase/phospholipase RssA
MKLGLFLTPGAARTAYQVGAVYALMGECKLRFDVIAASSVGALNGVFAAMGEIEELARTWTGWRSRDVLGPDLRALIEGAVFWAPNLMKYDYYQRLITDERVRVDKLLPGTRFRFNLANLTSGEQAFFEWPGASVDLKEAVWASVAVPALIEPREFGGAQWVDGLTVDGFPLEPLLLETGVDRVYVVGVAPRQTDARWRENLVEVLMRAIDWNQESETTLGIARAEKVNERIRAFADDRRMVERILGELVTDPTQRLELLAEVERAYEEAGFPYTRKAVDIVPILPQHDIELAYAHYDPRQTLRLIEQGRHDALAMVERLSEAAQ